MTELERYKEALDVAKNELRRVEAFSSLSFISAGTTALDAIESILHPEPEYEEVEVVRWFNPAIPAYRETEPVPDQMDKWVKLTGTLRRPKPQKVERSWTLENASLIEDGDAGVTRWIRIAPFPDGVPTGRRGTLTYTWTEEGEGK